MGQRKLNTLGGKLTKAGQRRDEILAEIKTVSAEILERRENLGDAILTGGDPGELSEAITRLEKKQEALELGLASADRVIQDLAAQIAEIEAEQAKGEMLKLEADLQRAVIEFFKAVQQAQDKHGEVFEVYRQSIRLAEAHEGLSESTFNIPNLWALVNSGKHERIILLRRLQQGHPELWREVQK